MRNRRGLNKIWMLAIAILIALGAVGVTYGAWTDEIYIEGSLSTSGINTALTCGVCWEEVNSIITNVPDTSITCSGTGMTRTITVTNAQYNVEPALNTHYYCNFIIDNTAAGSLPIKIQSITITDYTGVSEAIAPVELLSGGYQIDPGDTATGTVHIHLTSEEQVGQTLVFTLEVNVKRWNE